MSGKTGGKKYSKRIEMLSEWAIYIIFIIVSYTN